MRKSALNFLHLTARNYLVLGGQHFLKALTMLRSDMLRGGTPEAALPDSLKFAELEVLSTSCGAKLRAWAAGRHQKKQTGSAATIGDFLGLVVDEVRKTGQNYEQSDERIWYWLERSGMEIEGIKTDSKPGDIGGQSAADLAEQARKQV